MLDNKHQNSLKVVREVTWINRYENEREMCLRGKLPFTI